MFWIELRHSPGTKLRLKKTCFLDPTRYWVGYWTVVICSRLTGYKVPKETGERLCTLTGAHSKRKLQVAGESENLDGLAGLGGLSIRICPWN